MAEGPQGSGGCSCPRLGGYRQSPSEFSIRHWVRGAELHPGVSEQRHEDFPVGIQARVEPWPGPTCQGPASPCGGA